MKNIGRKGGKNNLNGQVLTDVLAAVCLGGQYTVMKWPASKKTEALVISASAIAAATVLCFGLDLPMQNWKQETMREYLADYFSLGSLSLFPTEEANTTATEVTEKVSLELVIFCYCRQSEMDRK